MLVLLNSQACRGKENMRPIWDRLAAAGFSLVVESSLAKERVSDAIIERQNDFDCVLVCGGDGTANSAARGLMQTRLPMGLLPMGTANDLARTLDLPLVLEQAVDIIIAGHTVSIDVASVNDHPFFNVASLGLSAELARGLSSETKRRWGRLSYALAAARVLIAARPFTAWISCKDERVCVKTLQIAIGNGRHYGAGNVVEESAEIDDGQLDLYSLELRNVLKVAMMLPSFRKGQHGAWKEVRTKRDVEFLIETRTQRPINADGELVTETPGHFKIHRNAVTVYRSRVHEACAR
jgi:YegS/Rv2252/BmrU family lipid kinase